jgi:ribosomal protein S28E/S33
MFARRHTINIYIILINSEKQRNVKARSYIIKCCGRKTCDGDVTRIKARNSSTEDSSRNAKRVPGGPGKIPGTEVAGNPSGSSNKLDKNNKK